jgi:thiol-disulfide isomerase/thioredoxin
MPAETEAAVTPQEEAVEAPAVEVEASVVLPDWASLPLVNARTGESFTLADFAAKPVLVEPMATWCTNCRRQLGNVSAAATQLGEEATFVALSVEADLPPDQLAAYAEQNGFPLVFAVVTPEILTALADQFGQTITNPPATPHFVLYPDGSVSELLTGGRSPEELVALLGS